MVSRSIIAALTDHTDLPQILIWVGVAPARDAMPPATPRRPLVDVLRLAGCATGTQTREGLLQCSRSVRPILLATVNRTTDLRRRVTRAGSAGSPDGRPVLRPRSYPGRQFDASLQYLQGSFTGAVVFGERCSSGQRNEGLPSVCWCPPYTVCALRPLSARCAAASCSRARALSESCPSG